MLPDVETTTSAEPRERSFSPCGAILESDSPHAYIDQRDLNLEEQSLGTGRRGGTN